MPSAQSTAVVQPMTHQSQKDFGAIVTGLDLENLSGKLE